MALLNRFLGYYRATFVLTGNNQSIRTVPNTKQGDIFTTATGGKTMKYIEAGSTAYFNMVPNSKVIFAELLWTAWPLYSNSVEFITPNNTTTIVNATFKQTAAWETNAADVTKLVQDSGSGMYTCNKINGAIGTTGWFLMIVYENPSFPLRYLSYYAGAVNDGSAIITINNIYTPKKGPVRADVFLGAYGTDLPDKAAVRIGPTVNNLTQIGNLTPYGTVWNGQKPYNPRFAFLSNLICVCDPYDVNYSLLDTRGTFGSPNPNPYLDIQPANTRAWMDIGAMNASQYLTNGQTSLVSRALITGDGWFTQNLFAVQVDINSAILEISKAVNKGYSTAGDTIIYTLTINNIGPEDAINVMLYDSLPTNVSFVPNSLNINNIPSSSGLAGGVNIGSVNGFDASTVSFSVKVSDTAKSGDTILNGALIGYEYIPGNSIPTQFSSAVSNIVVTTIINDLTTLVKMVDKKWVSPNGTVTYTVVITNKDTTTITNINFHDSIPITTKFVDNSVFVNGVNVPGVNPTNTVPLGISLGGNQSVTVNFTVVATGHDGTIPNVSNISYDLNVGSSNIGFKKTSNEVNTIYVYITLVPVKYVDKRYATRGDILTYTINITNNGNISTDGSMFFDTIPIGTTFVNNSSTVNGMPVSGNPETGINLPVISPNETISVTFKVIIN